MEALVVAGAGGVVLAPEAGLGEVEGTTHGSPDLVPVPATQGTAAHATGFGPVQDERRTKVEAGSELGRAADEYCGPMTSAHNASQEACAPRYCAAAPTAMHTLTSSCTKLWYTRSC